MNASQKRRFHAISEKMTRAHEKMLREPMQMKTAGAQKVWLDLYDELNKIGTSRDKG